MKSFLVQPPKMPMSVKEVDRDFNVKLKGIPSFEKIYETVVQPDCGNEVGQ